MITEVFSQEEIDAIPGPKVVLIENDRTFVQTGEDLPPWYYESRNVDIQNFRNRFTSTEMEAILFLAYGGDPIVQKMLFKLQTRVEPLNLDDAEVTGSVNYLIGKGLTAERAAEILA